jgi:glycosyltransferase involved in cell wall biosynthesis
VSASVSVVIATVGRPELDWAVTSALYQVMQPLEVLVINDGAPSWQLKPDLAGGPVQQLTTGGGRGASAARNMGLSHARGDFIAFLDDDDMWLPHHLQAAVHYLHDHPEKDIYSSAGLMSYPDGERVEPTVIYSGRSSVLEFFYGGTVWARRRRRVPLPTLVFRRGVGEIPMDESLRAFEDLWWILRAERAGFRLAQVPRVDVICRQDLARESSRLTLDVCLAWARRLDTLQQGAGGNYLVGHLGRTLARAGQREELRALIESIAQPPGLSPGNRALLSAERLLANVRRRDRN